MNFAIEVPGEAVPLNLQDLCKALQAGTSLDHQQRQSATAQLKEWEAHPDFFLSLQTVFLDKSLPRDIRFLAIILLKNGIDRLWRPAVNKNGIKPEQKGIIRSRLLQGTIYEEDKNLGSHNALVMAKVVRIDYPTDWPDAINTIIDSLRKLKDGNQAQLCGALMTLLRVIKELSSAKLRRHQTALQSVAPELVYLVGEIYAQKTAIWQRFLASGRGGEDDADDAMSNSLLCLRILRRLLVAGYEAPLQDKLVPEFWTLSQTHFGQFMDHVRGNSNVPFPYQDLVGKHLLQFTKLHIDMCESHPATFAALPNSIPLVRAYWDLVASFADVFEKSGGIRQGPAEGSGTKSKVEGPLLERLALKGLLLLKSCIAMVFNPMQTFRYRSREVKEVQDEAIGLLKTGLLTNDFVLQVVNTIVTKLFAFRASDLEAWEESPEEWEAQECTLGNAWEWQVRPCAERVFMDLLVHHKELLGPPLLQFFQTATDPEASIVSKEAVYAAMGCAVHTIYKAFDFDLFLSGVLAKDVQIQDPLAKLLRRRIAILVSLWVPVRIADQSRPLVFEMFRHLMKKDDPMNDEVVRITAARQLKWIADDFEFKAELFQPFAADILSQLVELLGEVDTDETKLAILETVRVIINRMDTLVAQFGKDLISILPGLWGSSGQDAFMIKQAILAIISVMFTSMRGESQQYHAYVLPLIAEALEPATEVHKFLLEEAVDMWRALLTQCSPPLSPELISLEDKALGGLEYGSKVSEDSLEIVKAYILLAPQSVLADQFRVPTLVGLGKTLESKNRDQVHFGTKAMQYLIRSAHELGGREGISVVVQDMLSAGLLPHMLERLHESWEAHQSAGPKAKKSSLSTVAETYLFSVLARIVLAAPDVFVKMLSSLGDLATVWNWLSAEWFSCFDSMADIERQKLSCLALTRFLELEQPMQDLVLGKLQDYFCMWTTVIAEAQDNQADGPDLLVWAEPPYTEYDTPLDGLDIAFAAKDPVRTEHTFTFVKARLQDLIRRTGGEEAFQENWAVNVDKEVVAGFQALSQPPADP